MIGLDACIHALEDMGKGLTGEEIQGVLKKAAKPLVTTIQSGIASKWGLPADIYGFVSKNDAKYRSAKGAAVLLGWNRTNVLSYIGIMFEYGTLSHRIEPLSPRTQRKEHSIKALTEGGLKSRPVIRPAYDTSSKRMGEDIKKGLLKLITDKAKKNNLKTI